MEFAIILVVGVFLTAGPLVVSIWAWHTSRKTRDAMRDLGCRQTGLLIRLARVEQAVMEWSGKQPASSHKPPASLAESSTTSSPVAVEEVQEAFTPPPLPGEPGGEHVIPIPVAMPVLASTVEMPEPEPVMAQVEETAQARARSPRKEPAAAPETSGMEEFIGGKLIAWIGGVALFFAAAFGLKYSFDHNLIPPAVRAAAGYLLGLGLITAGVVLKRRDYATTSQTFCATGSVILYAVIYACRSLFKFPVFTAELTFGLMIANTAAAFFLAVKLDGPVVAVLGIVGGFLTPVLLSSGQDRPGVLFPYIAFLDLGLLAVIRRKRWDYLAILGALGTVAMSAGWFFQYFTPEKLLTAQAVLVGFPLLFLAALAWASKKGWVSQPLIIAAIALPTFSWIVNLCLLGRSEITAAPGQYFWAVLVIDLILLAISVLHRPLRVMEHVAGMSTFVLLAVWTLAGLKQELLGWGLGIYLIFGLLHTGFGISSIRRFGVTGDGLGAMANFIPVLSLLLTLLPLTQRLTVPWTYWAVVLLIDAFAVAAAVLARAWVGLLFTFLMTLATAGVWMFAAPASTEDLAESLFVIGGFALFFFMTGLFVSRLAPLAKGGDAAGDWSREAERQTPALAALLPLVLLVLAVVRFHPQNPTPIFAVALGFAVAGLGLTVWRTGSKRPNGSGADGVAWLPMALMMGVAMLELAAYMNVAKPLAAGILLRWNITFAAVFMVFPFLFRNLFINRQAAWIPAALAAPIHFGLIYQLNLDYYHLANPGLIPAAFALPALASLAALAKWLPQGTLIRRDLLAWFGGVAALFVTLIFPIQFQHEWLTIGWALEGLALCWLFRHLRHPGLRWLGIALLTAAFQRLALNFHVFGYHLPTGTPVWNWYLYGYGIVAACLYLASVILPVDDSRVMGLPARPLFLAFGTLLVFLLLNIEIADGFSQGGPLKWELSGDLARGMTYTIAWSLFALGLVVAGFWARSRATRYSGLGLLGVALVKLFVSDLSHLGQLYRIGAFAGVAVIAITASVLYQRFLANSEAGKSPDENAEGEPR